MMKAMRLKTFLKAPRSVRRSNESGFTLIELMIVIAIIALIASLVGGKVLGQFEKAKVSSTKTQIKQLSTILDTYKLECGSYPSTEQGLDALLSKPAGAPECKNYDPSGYVKGSKLPKDAWGNAFIYSSAGSDFEIKSLGDDQKEGGEGFGKDLSSKDAD